MQPRLDRSAPIPVQVYEMLRDDIVTLRRPPGSRLSDKEISADLNVSRTPVREAILKLIDDGFAEAFPNSGTFVIKIQVRALRNAQFIRRALECAAIREAARRVKAADIRALETIVSDQDASAMDNPDDFYRLDELFHQTLFGISDHAEAWSIAVRAKAQLDRVRYLSVFGAGRLQKIIAEHRNVIGALSQGNGEQAEKALGDHLDAAYLALERTVTIFSQYFETPARGG